MEAGKTTIANTCVAPRVFISYARSDGERFTTELRQGLQAEHIPLWQDRVGEEARSFLSGRAERSQ